MYCLLVMQVIFHNQPLVCPLLYIQHLNSSHLIGGSLVVCHSLQVLHHYPVHFTLNSIHFTAMYSLCVQVNPIPDTNQVDDKPKWRTRKQQFHGVNC